MIQKDRPSLTQQTPPHPTPALVLLANHRLFIKVKETKLPSRSWSPIPRCKNSRGYSWAMPFQTISIKGTLWQESLDISSRVSSLAVILNQRATTSAVWLNLVQIWQCGKKPSGWKICSLVTGYKKAQGLPCLSPVVPFVHSKMNEGLPCHIGLIDDFYIGITSIYTLIKVYSHCAISVKDDVIWNVTFWYFKFSMY